jgi:drug/metabolite transporter (DMT)-like permease
MAALLLVIIIALFKRRILYIYPAGLLGCLMAGAVNGLGSIFYYVGLNKLDASIAQMLYALYPIFVAFWLQLDKQTPSKLTGFRIILASISAFFRQEHKQAILTMNVHADRRGSVCATSPDQSTRAI